MKSELEFAAIQLDGVSDIAQPSTSSSIGKQNTKSDFKKIKPAKGEKRRKNRRKRAKKSIEFEEDVRQTLDDSQPINYITKPDKGSFLTRVALKQELCLSFEHGYVVVGYQLKTFKTNLFQKGCQTLTNCLQYFYKRPLKFVIVGTFYGLCIRNRENFVHKLRGNITSHLEHLMPKNKVTIFVPSFNFLWYERSCAATVAIVDHFILDFSKYLELNEEIQELLERYKVANGVHNALRERYITITHKGGRRRFDSWLGRALRSYHC